MTTKLTDIIETTTDTLEVVQSVIDTAILIAEDSIESRIAILQTLKTTPHRRRALKLLAKLTAKLTAQRKDLESQ